MRIHACVLNRKNQAYCAEVDKCKPKNKPDSLSHIFCLSFIYLFSFFPLSFLPPFVFLIHTSVFYKYMCLQFSCNIQSLVTILHAGKSRNRSSILGMTKICIFSKVIRIALGLTQPPLHWMKGDFRG